MFAAQIENRKLEWNTTSKVGSMENTKHRAGGGNVKVRNKNTFINTIIPQKLDP